MKPISFYNNFFNRRQIIVAHFQNPLFLVANKKQLRSYLFYKTEENNCYDHFQIGFNCQNPKKIKIVFTNKSCLLATACLDLLAGYCYLKSIEFCLNLIKQLKNFLTKINAENEAVLTKKYFFLLQELIVFKKIYQQPHRLSCFFISLNLIEQVLETIILKNNLRLRFKKKLKNVNYLQRWYFSYQLCKKIIKEIKTNNYSAVAIYLHKKLEVNTKRIINYCFHNKIKVFVPKIKIDEDDNKFLIFVSWKPSTKYVYNHFHIKEPISNENQANFLFDVIIVPCLFFIDKEKKRCGYGYGYYDSYLQKLLINNPKVKLWLLAFKNQELKNQKEIKKLLKFERSVSFAKIFF